jgi:hypothetical protein
MILVLPQIQQAPEIATVDETNGFMRNDSSLIIKWEEDSANIVQLSSFLPIKESPESLTIMNQCYTKGKINER